MIKTGLFFGLIFILPVSLLQAELTPKIFEDCQNIYQNCMAMKGDAGYEKKDCVVRFDQCLKDKEKEAEEEKQKQKQEEKVMTPPAAPQLLPPDSPEGWEIKNAE